MKLKHPKLLVSAAFVSLVVIGGGLALGYGDRSNRSVDTDSGQTLLNPSGIKTANPQQAGVNQITESISAQGSQSKTTVTASPGCDVTTNANDPEDDMVNDEMDDNETSTSVNCESNSSDRNSGNTVNITSSSSQSVQSSGGNATSSNSTSINVDIN